jgi:hypothetical protein
MIDTEPYPTLRHIAAAVRRALGLSFDDSHDDPWAGIAPEDKTLDVPDNSLYRAILMFAFWNGDDVALVTHQQIYAFLERLDRLSDDRVPLRGTA